MDFKYVNLEAEQMKSEMRAAMKAPIDLSNPKDESLTVDLKTVFTDKK